MSEGGPRIVYIARKENPRGIMHLLGATEITKNDGMAGDHRGRGKKRQITVLSAVQWQEACAELGESLPWYSRRANLLVSDIRFGPDDVGSRLMIIGTNGTTVLEITGETTPCERMDEVHPGLRRVLEKDWRGGAACCVISGGIINRNDDVALVEKVA